MDHATGRKRVRPISGRPLVGNVVLVTGASGGIGHAIALRFASDGAAIVAHYNCRREPADALVAELTDSGRKASPVAADLSRSEPLLNLFEFAPQQFGGADIM